MSKAFRFRLDAALQQRLRQEQEAQLLLARAISEFRQAVTTLGAMVNADQQERAATAAERVLDVDARMNLLYYLDRSAQLIARQRQIVQQRDGEVHQVQNLVLAARGRRRALERLRERRVEEYDENERKLADKELDEQTAMRYGRLNYADPINS